MGMILISGLMLNFANIFKTLEITILGILYHYFNSVYDILMKLFLGSFYFDHKAVYIRHAHKQYVRFYLVGNNSKNLATLRPKQVSNLCRWCCNHSFLASVDIISVDVVM